MFLLSEKEAKIAKEKELGIYKEKKVTEFTLKNFKIRVSRLSELHTDRKLIGGSTMVRRVVDEVVSKLKRMFVCLTVI